jgi:dTDP-4-dehydrorhamnose reductase
MKILLFGANGQLGRELATSLRSVGPVKSVTRLSASISPVDFSDTRSVTAAVHNAKADLIVNAAAYTAVDTAESEPDLAYIVNARSVAALADAAHALDIPLVHFSTDYVFDGRGNQPYTEADATAPLNIYGTSKRAGEEAIVASGCKHLILRTGWVYEGHGTNFVLTMRRLANDEGPIRVVADQHGTPTRARSLAQVTQKLLHAAHNTDSNWWSRHSGIYHACAPDYTTWFTFAQHIISAFAGEERAQQVEPITTEQFPTPAQRPPWSVMSSKKLLTTHQIQMKPWRDQVDGLLQELDQNRALGV